MKLNKIINNNHKFQRYLKNILIKELMKNLLIFIIMKKIIKKSILYLFLYLKDLFKIYLK